MKLELGAGPDAAPGYLHTDIRRLPGVDVVCTSARLPFADGALAEVYGRHTLEHCTASEGRDVVAECLRVLQPGGTVYVVVPNVEAHVWQWVTGNREHSQAGFWGWQTHPRDVHKWGYCWESLRDLLVSCGFEAVTNMTGRPGSREHSLFHLEVQARKPGPMPASPQPRTPGGHGAIERMIPGTDAAAKAWATHLKRYDMAARLCGAGEVLDIGCGSGYGSAHLAQNLPANVTGVDISQEAIDYAQQNYQAGNLRYLRAPAEELPFEDGRFGLVVCFEVFEHLANPEALLAEAKRVLAPEGTFIVSTPNKLTFSPDHPDDTSPNPFHVREYRLHEFLGLLREAFVVDEVLSERYTAAYDAHVCAIQAMAAQDELGRSRTADPRMRRWLRRLLSRTPRLEAALRRVAGWLRPPRPARPKRRSDMDRFVLPVPGLDDVGLSRQTEDQADALYYVAVCRHPRAQEADSA